MFESTLVGLSFFGELPMRTLLSLSLCLLLATACSDPSVPPATDTGSDSSVVSDAGSASCPDDWEAADGTPCDQPGQNCNNCNNACTPCWILSCEDGTWMSMESHPPPDACTDAGPSDTGPDPTDADPDPTDAGPDPTDAAPDPTDAGPDPTDAGTPPLDEGSTTDAGTGELTWFTSCGDPVCQGWIEKPEMLACSEAWVQLGGPCASEGSSCDPHPCATGSGDCDPASGCNGVLTCAASDPKEDGCPISQRAAKYDIQYLNDVERRVLYEKLTQIPLASWRYKNLGPTAPQNIGFIIEDLKQSPAVQSTGERVNLYGYTTMAVAAFQVQTQQIKKLQGELVALRTELQGIRKGCAT
jgi:hypothetical protein